MGSESQCASHVCRCRCRVAAVELAGLVMHSTSPVVAMKLKRAFEPAPTGRSLYQARGDNWRQAVQTFYESLSPMERPTLRAVEIDAAGEIDPWQAAPLSRLLDRMATAWLPGVLNQSRMRAYLQPILDLRTETVAAFEALMRVEEHDGTVRTAGEVIEAAKAHDALFQFDQRARETALRQGAAQLEAGERLFINFCPTVIYDPAVCLQNTWQIAEELGLDFSRLVFEVVESERFPRLDHLRAILDAYRDRGALVALDDLGAGHAAIRYIDELQPDIVKLDRDLLPREDQVADVALLDGFVGYARSRGVKVVVEGIETAMQYKIARHVGVDYGQGYYIGRPSPLAERPSHLLAKMAG